MTDSSKIYDYSRLICISKRAWIGFAGCFLLSHFKSLFVFPSVGAKGWSILLSFVKKKIKEQFAWAYKQYFYIKKIIDNSLNMIIK